MAKRKRVAKSEDSWDDYDLDKYFVDAEKKSGSMAKYLFVASAVVGMASVLDRGQNDEALSNTIGQFIFSDGIVEVRSGVEHELKSAFTDEELNAYAQASAEMKALGLIEDPRTIENKAFADADRITDMMATFGGTEGLKGGTLDAYQKLVPDGYEVRIPWVLVDDDSTCEDCVALAEAGPYLPEDYPEPPHFGCRCEPGEPILVKIEEDDTNE